MRLLGFLFSLLLLNISFLGMPLSKQFYRSFKDNKKAEAKLNIIPGKLGQKFGEYYIYVKEKKGKDFYNIVIYNRTDKNNEQFFAAQKGKLHKRNTTTSLMLMDGYGYTYSDIKLKQAKYKTLEVYDQSRKNNFHFQDIVAFWSRANTDQSIMHKLLFYTFISLIPLLSVYLVAAFTMINPRYQQNCTFLVIFSISLLFYVIASALQKWGSIYLIIAAIFFTSLLGRWLFHQRVSKFF